MRLDDLVDQTPASRERYVDFLRAFSIVVVVFGHWFIALIWWEDGEIGVHNAIGVTKGMWLATWLLQVMPVFFFVGGYSNIKSLESVYRRGEVLVDFYRARAVRLLKPTAIFAVVWVFTETILHLLDVGGSRVLRGGMLPFGPLWFLLVYLVVILLTPMMRSLHERYGVAVIATLVSGAVLVDLLRFGAGVPKIGWLNLGLVWLNAHQLGFFYANGALGRSRRNLLALGAGGLAGLIVLTNIGTYPRSMLGTDVEVISNMNPPTLCIVALTFWLVGLSMLLREQATRWLQRRGPWRLVAATNGIIMTLFLWHLTALLLAVLTLYPLGLGHPQQSTASWWLQRPIWIVVPGLILTVLVAVFGRFERPTRSS